MTSLTTHKNDAINGLRCNSNAKVHQALTKGVQPQFLAAFSMGGRLWGVLRSCRSTESFGRFFGLVPCSLLVHLGIPASVPSLNRRSGIVTEQIPHTQISKSNSIRTWALSKWRAYGGDIIETDSGVYIKNANCAGELNTALHCLLRLTILEADA